MYSEDIILTNIRNFRQLCAEQGAQLVLASKTVSRETLVSLATLADFPIIYGENRVQEFCDKYFSADNVQWQFIGRLQTNKVKYLIGRVSLIQSVDRAQLADVISELSLKRGLVTSVLIEVNLGLEASKGGVLPCDFLQLVSYMKQLRGLRICGIMSVLPIGIPCADLMAQARRLLSELEGCCEKPVLSIGMSQDYSECLSEGSNMIRIGSAIFGKRS